MTDSIFIITVISIIIGFIGAGIYLHGASLEKQGLISPNDILRSQIAFALIAVVAFALGVTMKNVIVQLLNCFY